MFSSKNRQFVKKNFNLSKIYFCKSIACANATTNINKIIVQKITLEKIIICAKSTPCANLTNHIKWTTLAKVQKWANLFKLGQYAANKKCFFSIFIAQWLSLIQILLDLKIHSKYTFVLIIKLDNNIIIRF